MLMPNILLIFYCVCYALLHTHIHKLGSYLWATTYLFFVAVVWYQMFKTDDWAPLSAFNIFFTAIITL